MCTLVPLQSCNLNLVKRCLSIQSGSIVRGGIMCGRDSRPEDMCRNYAADDCACGAVVALQTGGNVSNNPAPSYSSVSLTSRHHIFGPDISIYWRVAYPKKLKNLLLIQDHIEGDAHGKAIRLTGVAQGGVKGELKSFRTSLNCSRVDLKTDGRGRRSFRRQRKGQRCKVIPDTVIG